MDDFCQSLATTATTASTLPSIAMAQQVASLEAASTKGAELRHASEARICDEQASLDALNAQLTELRERQLAPLRRQLEERRELRRDLAAQLAAATSKLNELIAEEKGIVASLVHKTRRCSARQASDIVTAARGYSMRRGATFYGRRRKLTRRADDEPAFSAVHP